MGEIGAAYLSSAGQVQVKLDKPIYQILNDTILAFKYSVQVFVLPLPYQLLRVHAFRDRLEPSWNQAATKWYSQAASK